MKGKVDRHIWAFSTKVNKSLGLEFLIKRIKACQVTEKISFTHFWFDHIIKLAQIIYRRFHKRSSVKNVELQRNKLTYIQTV